MKQEMSFNPKVAGTALVKITIVATMFINYFLHIEDWGLEKFSNFLNSQQEAGRVGMKTWIIRPQSLLMTHTEVLPYLPIQRINLPPGNGGVNGLQIQQNISWFQRKLWFSCFVPGQSFQKMKWVWIPIQTCFTRELFEDLTCLFTGKETF